MCFRLAIEYRIHLTSMVSFSKKFQAVHVQNLDACSDGSSRGSSLELIILTSGLPSLRSIVLVENAV